MVHTRGMGKASRAPPSSTNSTLTLPAPSRRIAGKRIAGKRTAGKRGPTKRATPRTPTAPKATPSSGEQPDTDDDSITCWIPAPEVPGLRPVEKNDFHTEGFVCLCYWSPDKTWFAIRICTPNTDPRLQDLLRDLISEAEAWSKKEEKQGGGAGGVPDKTTSIENFIRDTSPSRWYSEDDGGKQLDQFSWVPQMACMQFDETFARENKLPFVDLAIKDLASFRAKQGLLAMNESVQAMPANEEEMPVNNEEAMAVDDQEEPVNVEDMPVGNEEVVVIDDQEEPANEEDMPVNNEEVMVIDDQEEPANEEDMPVNDEEVMVIDDQEKPANEGEMLTEEQEKAAEKEEKPADEEGKPAEKEQKPSDEEEKAANEQEKPANEEDANDKAAEPEES
ncbi:hypothetical protein Z517_09270 [Fonsecaea pedrosoi CBS 271.37]|uniref:Unplaced genomic scaffold supercont1.6, whole genome shotgun sequence n=1 Tax=Fonsecaea pedrosoi CBS 271.37 TaxID=1442368 RepID=A0A0D2DGK7_9EURO|nr:uncharacterized protein Z517_09270 [Fonsecaea pedrosoi CBS 271.37]KIW76826.1 hypothetical protein Z517_09270 [Fonsecaea pedrosoi CBS 271.37]